MPVRARRPAPSLAPGLVAGLAAAGLAGAAAAQASGPPAEAVARLHTADGARAGSVEFVEGPHGVLVRSYLGGLPPGLHALHLHETGACTPDFSAAGGHFAPLGREHGFLSPGGPHAGDMPNIRVEENGSARTDHFNFRVTLFEGPTALLDGDGAAVVVHEAPDDYAAMASAGGRIACGVIRRAD